MRKILFKLFMNSLEFFLQSKTKKLENIIIYDYGLCRTIINFLFNFLYLFNNIKAYTTIS